MASYGLLGALGGLGKGLAETGTMMQKDAFEKAREARLEEARVRLEQRAEEAQKRQAVWSDERTYGAEAASQIPLRGTKALDSDSKVNEARAMIPVGVESAEAMIPTKVKEAEQMLPVDEKRAERIAAATGRGQEGSDNRRHAQARELQDRRETLANTPAAIATVEWIAQWVTNGDRAAAWAESQKAKTNPQDLAARLYMGRKKEARENFETVTDEEIWEDIQKALQMIMGTTANAPPPNPGATRREAPPEALEHLRQNPNLKDAFQQHYGYVPEGF